MSIKRVGASAGGQRLADTSHRRASPAQTAERNDNEPRLALARLKQIEAGRRRRKEQVRIVRQAAREVLLHHRREVATPTAFDRQIARYGRGMGLELPIATMRRLFRDVLYRYYVRAPKIKAWLRDHPGTWKTRPPAKARDDWRTNYRMVLTAAAKDVSKSPDLCNRPSRSVFCESVLDRIRGHYGGISLTVISLMALPYWPMLKPSYIIWKRACRRMAAEKGGRSVDEPCTADPAPLARRLENLCREIGQIVAGWGEPLSTDRRQVKLDLRGLKAAAELAGDRPDRLREHISDAQVLLARAQLANRSMAGAPGGGSAGSGTPHSRPVNFRPEIFPTVMGWQAPIAIFPPLWSGIMMVRI